MLLEKNSLKLLLFGRTKTHIAAAAAIAMAGANLNLRFLPVTFSRSETITSWSDCSGLISGKARLEILLKQSTEEAISSIFKFKISVLVIFHF